MINIVEKQNGVVIKIKVQPRSSTNEIAGVIGDAIKVRITSPPVEGEANQAVIRYFSGLFRLPQSAVRITSGLLSRHKTIEISGVSLLTAKKVLRIE